MLGGVTTESRQRLMSAAGWLVLVVLASAFIYALTAEAKWERTKGEWSKISVEIQGLHQDQIGEVIEARLDRPVDVVVQHDEVLVFDSWEYRHIFGTARCFLRIVVQGSRVTSSQLEETGLAL